MIRACLFILCICVILTSCTVSLNAGDTGQARTISIAFFPNNAPLVQPTLSQAFTEDLKNFFQTQSRLALLPRAGDLQLEGAITDYRITPVAITDQSAASSRLTISVNVKFTNRLDATKDFESTFSRFADFTSSQNLVSIETDLIKQINQQLAQDIFNKALINW